LSTLPIVVDLCQGSWAGIVVMLVRLPSESDGRHGFAEIPEIWNAAQVTQASGLVASFSV
jgi:hypothetical protein